jgi:hypothetical protein
LVSRLANVVPAEAASVFQTDDRGPLLVCGISKRKSGLQEHSSVTPLFKAKYYQKFIQYR